MKTQTLMDAITRMLHEEMILALQILSSPLLLLCPSCPPGLPGKHTVKSGLSLNDENESTCLTLAFRTRRCWNSPGEREIPAGLKETLSLCWFIHEANHNRFCVYVSVYEPKPETVLAALRAHANKTKGQTCGDKNTSWCVQIAWHHYSPRLRRSFMAAIFHWSKINGHSGASQTLSIHGAFDCMCFF